jgi:hypothetical protein
LTEVYHTPLTTATQGGTFIIVSPGRSSQHAARQAACVFFSSIIFFLEMLKKVGKLLKNSQAAKLFFPE